MIRLSKSAIIRLTASLVGCLGLIVLLWLLGPLVGLDSTLIQVGGTVLSLMLWGLGNFLISWLADRTESSMISALAAEEGRDDGGTSAAGAQEVEGLGEKLREALTLLKKSHSGGKSGQGDYLYTLPWYLIVGPPGSGKTTALLNSGLHFPLADRLGRKPVKGIGGTRTCDWFLTDEAVLVDTAGRYTTQDSRQTVDQAGWLGFLDLLKTYRGRQPVNGVLVAISLADLADLSAGERTAHVTAIKARLRELHERLGIRFPVYILFTKTDLIAGFVEFFEDLGRGEREQVLGVTFPLDDESRPEGVVAEFPEEFDALVGRMNDRLIDRVHQERDLRRRALIFGFPGQFASMKEVASEFLTNIFEPNRYDPRFLLRGVYFTSGTQEGTPIDRLLGAMSAAFGLVRPISTPFSGSSRSYFLTRLLREVVFSEAAVVGVDERTERRRLWQRRGFYAALALAVLGTAGLWGASFFSNEQLIAAVAAEADAYAREVAVKPFSDPVVADEKIRELLPLLNQLRRLPAGYDNQQEGKAAAMGLGLYQGDILGLAGKQAYLRALTQLFRPRLLVHLGNEIRADLDRPGLSETLHDDLKTFLMLSGQGPMNSGFVAAQFKPVWDTVFPGDGHETERRQLADHLRALLIEHPEPVDVGAPLIAAARQALTREQPADHAWRQVAGSRESKALPDWRLTDHVGDAVLEPVFVRKSNKPLTDGLPGRFTAAGFDLMLPAIGVQAKATRDESWVTGQSPADPVYADLERAILQRYLHDYAEAWDGLLNDLTIKAPQGPRQSADVVRQLSGPSSALVRVLDAVRGGTALALPGAGGVAVPGGAVAAAVAGAVPSWLAQPLADFKAHFRPIDDLTDAPGGKSPELAQALEALRAAHDPLMAAANAEHGVDLSSSNPAGDAAAALRRLDNAAGDLPPPVKGWLQVVTQGPANPSVPALRSQLDYAWRADVLQSCRQTEGKYPFSGSGSGSGSGSEMPMDDFNRLFAPEGGQGQFDTFFNTRLAHFVDAAAQPWRWQAVNNTDLGISPGVLGAFQEARRIRDGFFPNGGRAASVGFELRAIGFGPQTQEVVVEVDGEPVTFQRNGSQAGHVVWPNPAGPRRGASVTFTAIPPPAVAGGPVTAPAVVPAVAGVTPPLRVGYDGPWGWARLLQGRMQGSANRFTITITAGSGPAAQRVTLEMSLNSAVNPFSLLPELKSFRCPPSF